MLYKFLTRLNRSNLVPEWGKTKTVSVFKDVSKLV